MSSFIGKEGIKPKYMGSIKSIDDGNTKYRLSLLKERKFISKNKKIFSSFFKKQKKEHLIYGDVDFVGGGTFKKFYRIKMEEKPDELIDNYIFGKYINNKKEDVGLKKQQDLCNNNSKYIPNILDIGLLCVLSDKRVITDKKNEHSYVIMERVTGIEFAHLVDFILQSCLIFNNVGDCIRFKTVDELKREGINVNSLQFKFFSEVILKPLNVRVNTLKYLFQELLNAVNEIHKSGNLHLDIKLENMMIIYDENGNEFEKFKVKIIDFGFCTKKNSQFYSAGTVPYFNKNLLCIMEDSILEDEIYCRNSNSNDPNYYDKLKKHLTDEFRRNDLWLTKDKFDEKDDIYPLGLMFQVIFVICILNANEFNKYFKYSMENTYTNQIVNIKLANYKNEDWDEGWDPGMNLGHFIENFDFIKYIYKNIIELFLLSNNDTLEDTQNLDNVEELFHSIRLFKELKEYLSTDINFQSLENYQKITYPLLAKAVNQFYYRNQKPGTGAVTEDDKDKALFEKIKNLTSARPEGSNTKRICQQCFLLLQIVKKMLGTGVSEYDNIDEILNELINFNNDSILVTVQEEALEFVCDTDYLSYTLVGGSRQVGGIVATRSRSPGSSALITTPTKTSPAVSAPSSPQSPIEEAQVIDFKMFDQHEKSKVNKLFQTYYHSSFDMGNEDMNKIFIKPISRIPYEKTNPFKEGSNPSESITTEPLPKQKTLIEKINSLEDIELQTKLQNYFSVLFSKPDEPTKAPEGYKGRNVSFRKTIGLIDREVCYEILNDGLFSNGMNKDLQTQLKEAFGFTGPISLEELKKQLKKDFGFIETNSTVKNVGGFRKKRKSSKTKKRKLSKTNKRKSSKTNKRKSSTLRNKITLKNKKYKNVNKRKNHLKVIKTKITKKK